ncbi:sacsin N-terminal ATP-binding-like domain-containing protein [Butyrivibrio proteoclasticus]|uniref:sacsin N-terminal ATP-binding-like domain-containing protein n=1 Tax=Butyrivibrio proteoclasticus TaxID=43305 RepID=UPI00047DD195|nr:DUF3883 domain-containing protein [Butyrivibrio proteoclasticus]
MSIIERIHLQFIDEARKSPLLFDDLASMENYISESYSGRSIIELLQNADDARAKRVVIKRINANTYIVANDGREFTDEDLLSLCRSGASTKKRNSETIGYRGIGFKSVVNYAEVVHLVSGDIATTFSRELTKKELDNANKIPLIRVPHVFAGSNHRKDIDDLLEDGYKTVFVFEVKSDSFLREIDEFTDDSLIFLNSINDVVLSSEYEKEYMVIRGDLGYSTKKIKIKNTSSFEKREWLIIDDSDIHGKTSLAFKFDGEHAIKAEKDEAVIHSFLPTNDRLSMRMKINGDFSTDPSRTRVVQDEATKAANMKCAALITKIVENILTNTEDAYGLIEILNDATVDPLARIRGESPNDVIVGNIISEIRNMIERHFNGKRVVVQPDGVTNEDFDTIIQKLDIAGIGADLEDDIKGLRDFLKKMGVNELSSEECLKVMQDIELSDSTRSTVIVETIKESKLGMTPKKKELIENAKLFRFEDGVKTIKESEGSKIEDVFEGTVTEKLTTNSDYTYFAKKLGLEEDQLAVNNSKELHEHSISGVETVVPKESFKSKNVIKKWRTVEKNVAAVLELIDEIASVRDVSEQNIGYDLEALLNDGSRRYYEVKSVNKLGDTISFSNNEYSTCVSLKQQYYLAIACQTGDEISVCFVKNPVDSLHFEKRITRWDWMCGEYNGEVINTQME